MVVEGVLQAAVGTTLHFCLFELLCTPPQNSPKMESVPSEEVDWVPDSIEISELSGARGTLFVKQATVSWHGAVIRIGAALSSHTFGLSQCTI